MLTGEFKKTKILATLGPACLEYEQLVELIKSGVNVFRLNFSHGEHEVHGESIKKIVKIREEYGINVGILCDLQGPKLRIGVMEGEGAELNAGDIITFTNEKCVGNAKRAYMSYEKFPNDVKVGEKVLVDDGKLEFEVVASRPAQGEVDLKVLFGGVLKSKKGVNLPNTNVSLPSLTEKDREDLEYILTQPVNWIALSFVRNAEDIHDLRARINAKNHKAKIIAKIEKPEAVTSTEMIKIVKATDAIMIARGDLGIEVPIERLPVIQKELTRMCIQHSKPVVVATQMMDSMITNPSPTRAEVTDVANAVMDGADAVMLSGETSVGAHPALVVQTMTKIIREAEKQPSIFNRNLEIQEDGDNRLSDAICISAAKLANELKAKAILGMTASGYTAFTLTSCRPQADIFFFSDDKDMLSTLELVWGVRGFYYDRFESTDVTIEDVQKILKDKGLIKSGDVVINTASTPILERHRTNMVKVSRVS